MGEKEETEAKGGEKGGEGKKILPIWHEVATFLIKLPRLCLWLNINIKFSSVQFSHSVMSNSLQLMSIESVMPSSHIILCCPLLLLHPIPLSIRVFSNESTLRMRWPKY